MSRTKSFSFNSNSSGCIINNIGRNIYNEFNKIINDIHGQLFFDEDLTYQDLMYIINNRKTIENK
jgi:hypothetical protein